MSPPTKTKAIAAAKIKTDKVDATLLAADLLPQAPRATPAVQATQGFWRIGVGGWCCGPGGRANCMGCWRAAD